MTTMTFTEGDRVEITTTGQKGTIKQATMTSSRLRCLVQVDGRDRPLWYVADALKPLDEGN